jgi:hypothetical protein
MPGGGSARAVAVATAGLALLILDGCHGGDRPGTGAATIRPAPSPAAVTGSENYQSFDLYDDVCRGVAHPHAPAYAGSGPHPVAYFYDDPRGANNGFEANEPSTPAEPWDALDMRKVQLVVCVTSEDGPAIGSCGPYGGITATLTRGIFFIRLYETRTAKLVAGPIRLEGAPSDECPKYIQYKGHPSTITLDSKLSHDQVSQALRPYAS